MGAETVMIGWTTTPDRESADRLARSLIDTRLAGCVQISGPISSIYRWDGKVEVSKEFRLTVKFSATRGAEIGRWIEAHHPYETPQWVCCPLTGGTEKYLNWVVQDSS